MFHKRPAGVIRRLLPTGAAFVWMAFIFYSSSLSQDQASKAVESGIVLWLVDIRSYPAHAVLYGVLAALIQASVWGWKDGHQLRWVVAAAGLAALYGASDEYRHTFVAGRSATVADGIIDALGAAISVAGLWYWARLLRGRLARVYFKEPTRYSEEPTRYSKEPGLPVCLPTLAWH